jgi:uncharacterized protein with PIN domain
MAGDETSERIAQACFHFHAELNDFLPARRKDLSFAYTFKHRASIKDMIEALGVPHTEVDLILANGTPVGFGYVVRDGDDIAVYPHSMGAGRPASARAGPPPLAEARFVLDSHLGKLAAYLRLLGFDTLYRNDFDDETLARISSAEQRILLTRDRNLLKRGIVTYGYYVRETAPRRQVVEVLRRFDLLGSIAAYQRCIRCNGLLQPVHKETIADQLAPKTRQFYDEFHVCQACGQIYWKGSHYAPLQQFIEHIQRTESSH